MTRRFAWQHRSLVYPEPDPDWTPPPVPLVDPVLADAPVAFWPLSDPAGSSTAADATGHGYTGATVRATGAGVPTFGVTGTTTAGSTATGCTLAPAQGFHGVLDIIGMWSEFTLEGWVRCGPAGPSSATIAGLGRSSSTPTGGQGATLNVVLSGSRLQLSLTVNNVSVATTTAAAGPLNTAGVWHHVAVVRSRAAGTVVFYIDGTAVGTFAYTTGAVGTIDRLETNVHLRSGATGSTSTAYTVQRLGFFDKALSAAKIAAHAAMTPVPDPIYVDPDPPSGDPTWQWVDDATRSRALLSYQTSHGRGRFADRVGASTCTVTLSTELLAGHYPAPGDVFRIAAKQFVGDDAWPFVGADDLARFTGEVTGVRIDGTTTIVNAAGRWARASRYPVACALWAAEPAHARVARVLDATPAAAPLLDDLTPPHVVDDDWPQLALIPDGTAPTPAGALIGAVSDATGGQLVELPDGALAWYAPERRRAVDATLTLDAAQLLNALTWESSAGDLINQTSVSYAGGEVAAEDAASVAELGPYPGGELTTALVNAADAAARADVLVGRTAWPSWQLPALQVDALRSLRELPGGAPGDQLRRALAIRHGDAILLSGLPVVPPGRPGGESEAFVFVEGVTEQVYRSPGTHDTPARWAWRLTFAISDPSLAGLALRWVDLPHALPWSGLSPSLSWFDLARVYSSTDPALTAP